MALEECCAKMTGKLCTRIFDSNNFQCILLSKSNKSLDFTDTKPIVNPMKLEYSTVHGSLQVLRE